jgi:hypothetical protein
MKSMLQKSEVPSQVFLKWAEWDSFDLHCAATAKIQFRESGQVVERRDPLLQHSAARPTARKVTNFDKCIEI